eukprot:408565-Amphidinium_carterae.1
MLARFVPNHVECSKLSPVSTHMLCVSANRGKRKAQRVATIIFLATKVLNDTGFDDSPAAPSFESFLLDLAMQVARSVHTMPADEPGTADQLRE